MQFPVFTWCPGTKGLRLSITSSLMRKKLRSEEVPAEPRTLTPLALKWQLSTKLPYGFQNFHIEPLFLPPLFSMAKNVVGRKGMGYPTQLESLVNTLLLACVMQQYLHSCTRSLPWFSWRFSVWQNTNNRATEVSVPSLPAHKYKKSNAGTGRTLDISTGQWATVIPCCIHWKGWNTFIFCNPSGSNRLCPGIWLHDA